MAGGTGGGAGGGGAAQLDSSINPSSGPAV